jgi:prepilin-type N-terminal cleavage/methylation domain-containing protein
MVISLGSSIRSCRSGRGFTLAEVVISMAVLGLGMGGLLAGYIFSANRAEWSSYSLAAQSLAMQRLEQTRAARWDPWDTQGNTDAVVNANFPAMREVLDIPQIGTNKVWATNFTTITLISTSPPCKMIKVDCVWNFMGRRNYTNSVATCRAPAQ